jgi:hypothetical protein
MEFFVLGVALRFDVTDEVEVILARGVADLNDGVDMRMLAVEAVDDADGRRCAENSSGPSDFADLKVEDPSLVVPFEAEDEGRDDPEGTCNKGSFGLSVCFRTVEARERTDAIDDADDFGLLVLSGLVRGRCDDKFRTGAGGGCAEDSSDSGSDSSDKVVVEAEGEVLLRLEVEGVSFESGRGPRDGGWRRVIDTTLARDVTE